MAVPSFRSTADDTISTPTDHFKINTSTDGKNVRINSRDVTQTSGDHTAVQIKPQRTGTGTGGITGLEVSPRFANGKAGGDIRAILADPVLKAGTGDITGQVVGVESNIDFGISGTRTVTGDISAFSSFLAIPSTYTYSSGHVSFLRVRDVNIKGWDCFLNIDSTGTGLTSSSAITSGTKQYLKVKIADVDYQIELDKAAD